jgi:hypothetical protein
VRTGTREAAALLIVIAAGSGSRTASLWARADDCPIATRTKKQSTCRKMQPSMRSINRYCQLLTNTDTWSGEKSGKMMNLASFADDNKHSIGVRLCPHFGLSGKSTVQVNTGWGSACRN